MLLPGLAACANHAQQTPSGRPERFFAGKQPDAVRAALVASLVNRGYSITRESQSLVSAQRETTSLAANVLLGSQYDPTVDARITYTLVSVNGGTRVVADLAFVTNAGSAFERVTDMRNSAASGEVQAILNAVEV